MRSASRKTTLTWMALALALCASASLIAVEKVKSKGATAGAASRMAEEQRALHAPQDLFGVWPH